MSKCNACGGPIENGKCSYCGTAAPAVEQVSNQPENSPSGSQQHNPQQYFPPNQTVVNNNYTYTDNVSPKNKWVALILCIFFGYLGIHNFYAGKVGLGILYLLTFGLFGIGWIVDIIRILTGSYLDKWGRRLQV